MTDTGRKLMVVLLPAIAYLVAFPDDAQSLVSTMASVLGLTVAVSPWLYGLLATGVVLIVVLKIYGRNHGRNTLGSP
jgi:hypothetical protein